MSTVVHLELNELNFNYIEDYTSRGLLPSFKKVLEGGFYQTKAGEKYENLEPWIQWPTVYRGISYEKHGVFRLGDAVRKYDPQIWEKMEEKGLEVEALFPMNAVNTLKRSKLFLPDPWTDTTVTAPWHIRSLYNFARDGVLNNSRGKVSLWSALQAIPGLASIGDITFWKRLAHLVRNSLNYPRVYRPLVLDLIVFQLLKSRIHKGSKLHYISAFMNAGAHMQHHYYFDSAVNSTGFKNPKWYSPVPDGKVDPLFELYNFYDQLVGELISMDIELFISTGLSQQPNEEMYHQYRIIDFKRISSVADIDMDALEVHYRMSRDFEIQSKGDIDLKAIKSKLLGFTVDSKPLFNVDDRGHSLFCKVKYHGEPSGLGQVSFDSIECDLSSSFVHVSVENQIHSEIGYFADPKRVLDGVLNDQTFALDRLHSVVLNRVIESNLTS